MLILTDMLKKSILVFDSEYDDFFYKGLGRAIKVLKAERKE